MKRRFEGRVAIVTGAASNIGEACARAFAAEGARVALADINLAGAQKVADEIRSSGGDVLAHQLDLAEEASIIALQRAVVDRYGRIDVLHNNAADTRAELMTRDMHIASMEAEVWDRTFAVNTRGPMLMTKHVVPVMLANGGGSIVNTSSGVAIVGDLPYPAYGASKSALNSLTRFVAAQYGKQNIRCNTVMPGLVPSTHLRTMLNEAQIAMFESHILVPRLGRPENIAAAVLFLASDDAVYITGQCLAVDGGITCHLPTVADMRASFENPA